MTHDLASQFAADIARPFYQSGANFARCDFDARSERMTVRHARSDAGDLGLEFSLPGEAALHVCRYMYNARAHGRASHPSFRETQRQTALVRVEVDGTEVDLELVSLPRANGFTLLLFAVPSALILMADQVALVEREAASRLRARVRANGDERIVAVGQVERAVQELCDFPGVGKHVTFAVEYFETDA
ncbi:hypothetical protein bAD24_p00805 (plasmid) [Burkholderia sp. AD24]|nr:hypothetical protein bAD24_p00805 [Burkholderia sp. AD24]